MVGETHHIRGRVLEVGSLAPLKAAVSVRLRVRRGPIVDQYVRPEVTYFDAWTEDDGRFSFEVPASFGPHVVTHAAVVAWSPGHGVFARRFTIEDAVRGPLEPVLEDLERIKTLAVSVVGHDDTPLPGIGLDVELYWLRPVGRLREEPHDPPRGERGPREENEPRLVLEGVTDAKGVLLLAVPHGYQEDWTYHVSPEARGSFASNFSVIHGSATWNLKLHARATLEIEVKNERGEPEPDARVEVAEPRGPIRPIRLDGQGRCRYFGEPGTHRLSVVLSRPDRPRVPWRQSHGVPDLERDVVLVQDDVRTLTLVVPEPSASLACSVRCRDGSIPEGEPLWVRKEGSRPGWAGFTEARVGSDGTVRFGSFQPGRHHIDDSGDPNDFTGREALAVVDLVGVANTVEIVLPRRRSVRGVVKNERGEPLDHVQIHARDDRRLRRGNTNQDGAFEIDPLAEGKIWLSAFLPGYRDGDRNVVNDGSLVEVALTPVTPLVVRGNFTNAPRSTHVEVEACVTGAGRWLRLMGACGPCWCRVGGELKEREFVVWDDLGHLSDIDRTLLLRIGHHAPVRAPIAAGQTELMLRDLVLEEGLTIRGRVTDPESLIKRGGRGTVRAFQGIIEGAIAPDGTFEVRGLPPEPVAFEIFLHGPMTERTGFYSGELTVDPRSVPNGDLGLVPLTLRG